MYTYPDRMSQVARQHQRELLAEARKHQLLQQSRPARQPRGTSSTITRRLLAAFAKVGAVARVAPAPR